LWNLKLKKMNENMKKIVNVATPAVCAVALILSVTAISKTNAATAPAPIVTSTTAAPAGQPVDLTYAAEKALPSVVYIKSVQNSKVQTVEYSDPFEDFFSDPFGGFFGRGQGQGNGNRRQRQVQTPKRAAAGSGVIISADGYIVTNNHVVDGADELTVSLNEGSKEYSARVIGADKTTDLALIKIDAKNLPAITIANSDDVKVGEWVLAVGNPLGLNNTVTAGIISAKARTLGANGVESFIQTDAAINQGNSGGALVNTRGELVGINAMLASPTGSNIGYGFAIPTAIMNKVVDDLKQYGNVQRAMIGIQGSDVKSYVDNQKDNGKDIDLGTMEGIYVAKVVEDGAAEAAGLKEGDVITSLDGKKVTSFGELQGVLAKKRPGDKVNITYLRDKKSHKATLTLKNEQGNTKVVKNADTDVLGADFRPITDAQKKQLEISYGLEVIKVNGGKMKDAGVPKGFIIQRVNDEPMRSFDDLQNAVKEANNSKDQMLVIRGIFPTGKKGGFVVYLQNE
jgi:Do/DeqQ family serine protease